MSNIWTPDFKPKQLYEDGCLSLLSNFHLTNWLRVKINGLTTVKQKQCTLCHSPATSDWGHLLTSCPKLHATVPPPDHQDQASIKTYNDLVNMGNWTSVTDMAHCLKAADIIVRTLDRASRNSRSLLLRQWFALQPVLRLYTAAGKM